MTKFFMPTWWVDWKNLQFFFHGGFFFKSTLSVLRCTWTGRINLKIFLGYHINYLSSWPFMCHPWFPTRKASNLTFVCFQHHVLNTMQGLKNVVECYKEFFGYFNALETHGEKAFVCLDLWHQRDIWLTTAKHTLRQHHDDT